MTTVVFIGLAFFITVSALPTPDQVIYKLDDGIRYQYVPDEDGNIHLQDMWVKTSNLKTSARFNPDTQIAYHLFTRQNPTASQVLGPGTNLRNVNFNARRRTVVLIHGWAGSVVGASARSNQLLVPAILAAADVNVLVVDWSRGFGNEYATALANTMPAARSIARFIDWVNRNTGATPAQYHIIGHGVGGHQAGMVGRHVNGMVSYITALDAALMGFVGNPDNIRPRDGSYVEVIHTNAFGWGYVNPLGHVDFYPNGGVRMPGCFFPGCDHSRAYEFMAESIRSGGFTGRRCSNLNDAINGRCTGSSLRMGGLTPKPGSSGIFHVPTNAHTPFSRG